MSSMSRLNDARLNSLYDADGFGGEKTMRATVIRELITEIRELRRRLADSETRTENDGTASMPSEPR